MTAARRAGVLAGRPAPPGPRPGAQCSADRGPPRRAVRGYLPARGERNRCRDRACPPRCEALARQELPGSGRPGRPGPPASIMPGGVGVGGARHQVRAVPSHSESLCAGGLAPGRLFQTSLTWHLGLGPGPGPGAALPRPRPVPPRRIHSPSAGRRPPPRRPRIASALSLRI